MTCELPQFYREKTVQANKKHRCCECNNLIKPGTHYIKITGVWNSEWSTYKTCLRCDHIKTLALKRYPPDFDEEMPGFGLLYD